MINIQSIQQFFHLLKMKIIEKIFRRIFYQVPMTMVGNLSRRYLGSERERSFSKYNRAGI